MTPTTQVAESKFRMILIAAKRARQIQAGAKPLVHTTARKSTRIALDEFRAGVLPYETLPSEAAEGEAEEPARTPKSKK